MRRPVGGLRRGAVPFGLGMLAAAGQAPLGAWPLTLVALTLLTHRVARQAGWRGRAFVAWVAGAGYFGASLFWIVEPFMVDAARDGWMAPFALIMMAAGMALFWGLAGIMAGAGRDRRRRAIGFGLGLAATDLARGYVLTGFPWALLGHVWIDTPVAQAAAIVGPVGLSLLTVGLSVVPVLGLGSRTRLAGTFIGAVTLLGVVWAGGLARLAAPDPVRDPPIRVRLVQPNATQSLKWQPGMWEEFVERQMRATAAPAQRPLDLVVWPETAIPWLLDDARTLIADAVAVSGGVPVAMGIQRAEGPRYYNSLVATDRSGAVTAIYDKVHLVPFGEYIPFGDLAAMAGVTAFAAQAGHGYSAGAVRGLLDLGRAGRVLPLICYEAVFPQDLRRVKGRADWILQVTNDGWFGALAGPFQHIAQARLRAIEQGLPLLRSANTGVTAAFDAKGRPLGSLALDTEGWLDIDVPAGLAPTPYARFGDWPVLGLLVVGFAALSVRQRRRGN